MRKAGRTTWATDYTLDLDQPTNDDQPLSGEFIRKTQYLQYSIYINASQELFFIIKITPANVIDASSKGIRSLEPCEQYFQSKEKENKALL